jgi:energy-coupling factor transporter ATP-binding protein EcfA2
MSPLDDPVGRFVAALTPVLADLARGTALAGDERLGRDVVVEAADLVAAIVDSDERHSDAELDAYLETFGPRLPTQLAAATPTDLRAAGLLRGKRAWLARPSALFELLVDADRAAGSTHAKTYYEHALGLAYVVASVDAVPSARELAAIDAFRDLLLGALSAVAAAPAPSPTPPAAPVPQEPPEPLDALLAKLDALIGLEPVKAEVRLVANLLTVARLRRERGLPVPGTSHHLVFTGNPGTGKTTVARLLARVYRTLGVVPRGHLLEVDRSQLVAGYVGQTAQRVRAAFDEARGGVLLIDEAYALMRGGDRDFGQEAIDTIVKLVEDRRDDTVVIVAGYPDEMEAFLDTNPGLRSRFPKTIFFPDYTTDELLAIFELLAAEQRYVLTDEARERLRALLDAEPRGRGFGNGRLARNLFEQAIARQASRIVALADPSEEDLVTLRAEDVA